MKLPNISNSELKKPKKTSLVHIDANGQTLWNKELYSGTGNAILGKINQKVEKFPLRAGIT